MVHNERTKPTATYLNTAAAAFGLAGPAGHLPTLTLGLGALILLCASLPLHVAARYVLKGLKP